MATYALVAGNWLGGWAWEDVTARLRAKGHDVHPVTLTGVGDRVHLAGPEVDLDTHVADIVNTIEYADLDDVVLVGHSYGGVPVTGALDRIPERIARVVYVDSGPLADGMSQLDTEGPDARDAAVRQMEERENGWQGPLPSWEELGGEDGVTIRGLGPAERARFAARATPQPLGANAQALYVTNPDRNAIPHTLVHCIMPREVVQAMMDAGHPYFAAFEGKTWDFVALPTGHWPMFSEPAKLAEILDGLARAG